MATTTRPFDRYFEELLRAIAREESSLQSGRSLNEQRLREDVGLQRRRLGQQHQEALGSLSADMATKGLFRSGINVAERGKIGQKVTEGLGELGQAESRGMSDIARDFLGRQRELGAKREQAEFERTRAAQSDALEQALAKAQAQASQGQISKLNQRTKAAQRKIRGK